MVGLKENRRVGWSCSISRDQATIAVLIPMDKIRCIDEFSSPPSSSDHVLLINLRMHRDIYYYITGIWLFFHRLRSGGKKAGKIHHIMTGRPGRVASLADP
jgi:hypothetical protein